MLLNPSYIFELAKRNFDIYDLIVGKEVKHKIFGNGIVTKIQSNISSKKHTYIYIKFDEEKRFNEDVHKYLIGIKLDKKDIDCIRYKYSNEINRINKNNEIIKQNNDIFSNRKAVKNIDRLNKISINLTKSLSDVPLVNKCTDYINDKRLNIEEFENIYKIEEKEKQEIKDFIKKNNINEIIHFTQLDNLESIMEKGLLSTYVLERNKIKFSRNDYNRFDNLTNTICVSIGFPNYKMFYRLRDSDSLKKWVILIIKPEILYEKTCVFCYENAASYNMNSKSIMERTGSQALENLFYKFVDINTGITRDEIGIRKNHTTNPQAEVLVFNRIEPSYIKGIVFSNEDRELCKKYTGKYKDVKVVSNNYYYRARSDYKFWGGNYGKTSSICCE